MSKDDIFFFEAFEEEEAAIRNYLPANIKAGFSWKTIQEFGAEEPPARIISTRTQSVYPISWSSKIEAILSRSTGYDHLLAYLLESGRNIHCGYLPLYCHRAVAEQAMLLWMALLRKLPQQTHQFKTFHRDGLTGRETSGKTLSVFGVGNIGSEICKIGVGLGMNVLGVEIDIKHPEFTYVSKEEAIQKADIIVCSMNLTNKNRNYFTYDLFENTNPETIFINISRGEISPATTLLKAIKSGKLGGIGLDVFDAEKELAGVLRAGIKNNNQEVLAALELLEMPNVILTPHNAFNSKEGVERKSAQSVQQAVAFIEKGEFIWKVENE